MGSPGIHKEDQGLNHAMNTEILTAAEKDTAQLEAMMHHKLQKE